MPGWGTFLGRIAEQFQGRMERNRNEYDRLVKEKEALLKKPQTDASTKRMGVINKRLAELEQSFRNAAKD